ncbi:MAG: endo-1,4-beta-xylanase [Flavisolibacter sp.]
MKFLTGTAAASPMQKMQAKSAFRRIYLSYLLPVFILFMLAACSKNDPSPTPPGPDPQPELTGPLKKAAPFTIGFALSNSFLNNNTYRALVLEEASGMTPENALKHSSVVRNDGSYDFTSADALVNAAASAGLQVFGHVLAWHSQQNTTYLKTFSGLSGASGPELLTNNSFENGMEGWSIFNSNGATISAGSNAADAHTGSGHMKVVNPTANGNNQWKVQVSSAPFTTTPGKDYVVSYWAKAGTANGSIRLSTGPEQPQYQPDQSIGTSYRQITWTFTAKLSATTILFDMGAVANTCYIDDVSVKEAGGGDGAEVAGKLDEALQSWITAAVSRYAGKINAWDVVNEIFAENGSIRNNQNTPAEPGVFVWSHYLGRDFALKAFQYAAAADPNALLFINDYNLESSTAKLDSLVAFVKELKAKGAKVDGIGTQMHISVNTSVYNIDRMFQKLAATGLKVRISELDIRVNPSGNAAYSFTTAEAEKQATMYKNVVASYMRNVPAAHRHGITFWGVDDASSWIVAGQNKNEYPLLFDKNFQKKPAYTGVLQALKQN